MNLWCDKYRPKTFDQLDCQLRSTESLQRTAERGNLPHVLISGPAGSGKKTLVSCLLHKLYGDGIESIRTKKHKYRTTSETMEITTICSKFHTQINPSDVEIYDRVVIEALIETISQDQKIENKKKPSFKVIVVHEVDKLSQDAQKSFLHELKKDKGPCRFIFSSNSTLSVIPDIRSQCTMFRITAPTNDEISRVLNHVSTREGTLLSLDLLNRIQIQCQGNLHKALLMAQASVTKRVPSMNNQTIEPDWETYVRGLLRSDEEKPRRINSNAFISTAFIVIGILSAVLLGYHIKTLIYSHQEIKQAKMTMSNGLQIITGFVTGIMSAVAFGPPIKAAWFLIVGLIVILWAEYVDTCYTEWLATFFFLTSTLLIAVEYFCLRYKDYKEKNKH